MSKRTTFAVAISTLAVGWLAPGIASAHNAACVVRPDGTRIDIGSNRDAPIVGSNNPNINRSDTTTNLPNQLDLLPDTNGDQYGARYAATRSARVLAPDECPS
jgi:hypothetical protein